MASIMCSSEAKLAAGKLDTADGPAAQKLWATQTVHVGHTFILLLGCTTSAYAADSPASACAGAPSAQPRCPASPVTCCTGGGGVC